MMGVYGQSGCAGCAQGTVIMNGTTQGTVMEGTIVTPETGEAAATPAAEATPPTPDDT